MKTIKAIVSDTYANPTVSLPHQTIEEGEVYELDDAFADRIVEIGGAELTDEVVSHDDSEDDSDSSDDDSDEDDEGWIGVAIEKLKTDHGAKALKAACVANELDNTGNKSVLAERLVKAGIKEI